MRSLWAAASGLTAQQSRMDAIANNLANVNTTGYKTQDVHFKDLLYAQFEQQPAPGNLQGRLTPSGLRLGHGVYVSGLTQQFAQGSLQNTDSPFDMAIEGNGFFVVRVNDPSGKVQQAFTRDGSFKVGMNGTTPILTDSAGRPVLDDQNQPIDLTGYDTNTLRIDAHGTITAKQLGSATPTTVASLQVAHVDQQEANLVSAGDNLFVLRQGVPQTVVSNAFANPGDAPTVHQNMLEMSNVSMTDQMTEMIMAQRAYSMNAKALETTDQMMGIANNLRNGS